MQKFKTWLLIFAAAVLAYGGSLKYGFSQDDYYFLLISKADSLTGVFDFFSPWHQQGFAFFRPLGTQLYYYLFTSLFTQNGAPLFMHIFMLLLQSINGYLVYRLVKKLSGNKISSLLLGLAYATSSAHFLSLYYIAATQQLLAASFSLLSLNAFVSKKYLYSGLWMIPALLSKESALVTPAIAFILSFYESSKFDLRKWVRSLLPYVLFVGLYLVMRFVAGVEVQKEYVPVIGSSLLSTIRWYLLFGYGAPEELLRYGLSGFGIRLGDFIHDFGYLGLASLVSTFSLAIYTVVQVTRSLIYRKPFTIRQLLILFTWFITGIILIVWYPDHRYPHYLDLSLIPLLYLVIFSQSGKGRYFLTLVLIIASLCGITISSRSHWTVGRSNMVEKSLEVLDWQAICTHDKIAFRGQNTRPLELSYSLSLENGPRVICNNPNLQVYYGNTEMNGFFTVPIDQVFK